MAETFIKDKMNKREWDKLLKIAEGNPDYEPLLLEGVIEGFVFSALNPEEKRTMEDLMDDDSDKPKDSWFNEGQNIPPGYNSEGNHIHET